VNLTVYLKLWLPLDENKGGLIFQKVLVTLDLVETRHTSIRLPNNTIQNSKILFFDIFLLLRITTEVTIENLSLNNLKTWPMEFYEDCKKCEKTLGGENSNFRGKFGDSKIVEPAYSGDSHIWICFNRFWYMERRNRSSYLKVMAVLRTDSELEDKTVWKCENLRWWLEIDGNGGKNTWTGL